MSALSGGWVASHIGVHAVTEAISAAALIDTSGYIAARITSWRLERHAADVALIAQPQVSAPAHPSSTSFH